jgi:glycosyltransferase involved in cell wall biosynthesis
VIFRAFARARRDLPRARLLVVGSAPPDLNPRRLAAAAGLDRDAVEIIGYTDAGRFARLLAGVDVGVSLRHPTLGETSGAVVRWLGVGVPVVVSTGGWYDELPDEAVVRIAPDEAEEESLATALARLGSDPDLRRRMGDAGRAHARERMAPGAVADAYLRFLLAPRGRRALADRLLASLAGALADVAPASARSAVGLPRRLGQAAREAGVL